MDEKIKTAPRISPESAEWYKKMFGSINAGMEFVANAFPMLYSHTITAMPVDFSEDELDIILNSASLHIVPKLSGRSIIYSVGDWLTANHKTHKTLIDKLNHLSIWHAACLELWAKGYWEQQTNPEPVTRTTWISPLLKTS